MEIVARTDVDAAAARTLTLELRTSIEVGGVAWALAQADYSLKGRPIPEKITDLHPQERRQYEDRALEALMGCNRDAELYAWGRSGIRANEMFVRWCEDRDLDWLTHPAADEDALEIILHRIAEEAIQRYQQTLSGTYPGMTRHLAKLQQLREVGE